jgi:UPF0176 protein
MNAITATTILNIAAYKFVALADLPPYRAELRRLCQDLELRGTIMLSPEGINLFVAGEEPNVRHLLEVLRSNPLLEDLEVKESYSDKQPFNRMLVKLKREIIAFGIDEVRPAVRTSPKLKATELKQWISEGRKFRLLDTRNVYEIDLGTFQNAEHLNINHFRDFPEAIAKLPEESKQEPIVMFCTGGIRCEKAGPMMEQAGFQQVYQLDGGILKYFEECGGEHYEGACFVFDNRVALDPELKPTGELLCFACQSVITHEDMTSPNFLYGEYCPKCFMTPEQAHQKQLEKRQLTINKIASPLPGSLPYDNVREIHVPGRFENFALIDFLDAWHPPTGRAQWFEWLATGRITMNEQSVAPERVVRGGECFVQHMPDTLEPDVNAAITLLHEDELLVVVNKPAPLPAHASGRFNRNTLDYIVGTAYRPERLRIAHRLDANTTGLVIFCRKHAASRYVQPQFSQQMVDKVYVARVHGHPSWQTTTCDLAISSEPGPQGVRSVDVNGQPALTEFNVVQRFEDGTSLLEAYPKTGRTNQIRIHLAHLGHTIVGDPLYGVQHSELPATHSSVSDSNLGANPTLAVDASPMCLHAWKLSFNHPKDRQRATYTAPLPQWAKH